MYYTVDRVEEGLALVESPEKTMLNIPLEKLPAGVKAGDVLCLQDGVFLPAPEEQKVREARIQRKMDALWQ